DGGTATLHAGPLRRLRGGAPRPRPDDRRAGRRRPRELPGRARAPTAGGGMARARARSVRRRPRRPGMTFDAESIAALAPGRAFALDGKVAVVTGAGGGIGRWLAAGLGVAGARVLVTDYVPQALEEVQAALSGAGIEAVTFTCDLADEDAPERIVSTAVDLCGRIDVLVNCAAVNRRLPILDMDRETYDWIMRIDLRLPYFLSQQAARAMRGGGAIVNVSSLNFQYVLAHISVYGPAKAGLSQLTRVMALEWADRGIRANAIAPGYMDTPLAAPIW